jgi:nucleoside phosphorylase
VLLMGIAAGVRGKVRIGDVVLSERVVAYEPAALVRSAGGSKMEPRPEIDRAPHAMIQDVASYLAAPRRVREAVRKAVGEPPAAPAGKEEEFGEHVASSIAVGLGTIASGEKLLRDPAKLLAVRAEMHGKTEAGEMEAVGVVEACRRNNVPWLVIRGISDFGDELKDDRFHGFAARAAAAALVDFVAYGLDLGATEDVAAIGLKSFTKGVSPSPGAGATLYPAVAPETPPPPPADRVFRARNPFVFGRPIDQADDFLGRGNETRWIQEAIEKGQPVQVLGENLMGKTSLLRWVQRNVLLDRPVVWVDPTRGLTPASMVLSIARALGKAEAAAALGRPEASAGEAAGALDALVPFVLLMDDADALAGLGRGFDDGFFGALRGLVQSRKLTWVSASRRNLYDLFKGKGLPSEFLNDAVKVWAGPLDAGAARELAERGAPADVDRVVAEASGFAYGLQWLGDFLYRRPKAIEPACDAFADELEPVFERWWGGLEVLDRQLLKGCLAGEVRVEGLENKARRRLRRLVERGFSVEREGRFLVEGEAWRGFVGDAG